jgi:hypothetical protein
MPTPLPRGLAYNDASNGVRFRLTDVVVTMNPISSAVRVDSAQMMAWLMSTSPKNLSRCSRPVRWSRRGLITGQMTKTVRPLLRRIGRIDDDA